MESSSPPGSGPVAAMPDLDLRHMSPVPFGAFHSTSHHPMTSMGTTAAGRSQSPFVAGVTASAVAVPQQLSPPRFEFRYARTSPEFVPINVAAAAAAAAALGGTTTTSTTNPPSSPPRRSRRVAWKPEDTKSSSPEIPRPKTLRKRKRKDVPAEGQLKDPPQKEAKTTEDEQKQSSTTNSEDAKCCICMSEPEPNEKASISGCEHKFCFECIEKWSERENTCPLCKNRFTKINRLHKAPRGTKKKGIKSSKRVKKRNQREDNEAMTMQGLFAQMEARLVFGGFSSSLFNLPEASPFREASHRAAAGAAAAAAAASRSTPYPHHHHPAQRTSAILDAMFASGGHPARTSRARSTWGATLPPLPLSRVAQAAAAASSSSRRMEDALFSSEDDDDDDEDDRNSFDSFVQHVRNMNREGFRFETPAAATLRSFASNMNDVHAGDTAENALEIMESDSDDDEVEVVDVVAGGAM